MATYEERAFLFRCSEKLSTKQSKALVSICDLPADLRDQDAFDVILELKKRGKYNKLEELATILKDIDRDDLAKEVTAFAEEMKHALDANEMFECVLQETKEQFHSLTDQMQKLRDVANEAGKRRIEQIVDELISTWPSEKIDKKLKYISCLLAGEKHAKVDQRASLPPRSSSIGSRSDSSTPSGQVSHMRRSSSDVHQRCKRPNLKVNKLSKSQSDPAMPASQPSTKRELPPTPNSKSWIPVLTKPNAASKPVVKPKPKNNATHVDPQELRRDSNEPIYINMIGDMANTE